ncbi:MAG: hypothetical protein ACRCZ2_04135 [Fusobacteriaceae bacterium]
MSKFYEVAITNEITKFIKLEEILSFQASGENGSHVVVNYKNGESDTFMAQSLFAALNHAETGVMSIQRGEAAPVEAE